MTSYDTSLWTWTCRTWTAAILMADVQHGEESRGSDEPLRDQEVMEGREEGGCSVPPKPTLLAIEYNPAMLECDDLLASMKPDVYTETVPSGDQYSIHWLSEEEDEGVDSTDLFKKACNSIFSDLLASISQEEPNNSHHLGGVPNFHPYFDMSFVASDHHTVFAHRIFLARSPNFSNLLQTVQGSSSSVVRLPQEIKLDSLVKVLELLYSTSTECEWIKETQFPSAVYSALVNIFGEGEKLKPLKDHLETFVCSPLFSDAKIRSGPFRVPVHKVVLCGRSDYFAKAFSPDFLSSRTGETELADTDSTLITVLLDYLYTGNVEWATSLEVVADMLVLANRVQDNTLCQACSEVVASQVDLDNCCVLYNMSQQLSQSHLQWHCTRFIVDHYDTVVSQLPTDYVKIEESSRNMFTLMYETLRLNPVGKGKGFGCIRELIGTLSEALMLMDERLKIARECHVLLWHSCRHASNMETQYSLRMLQKQEVYVEKVNQFLMTLKSRYESITNLKKKERHALSA